MGSERGGGSGKAGPDTLDAIASARTVRSDPRLADAASAPTLAAEPGDLPSPEAEVVLGERYRLIEELGRGGEGVVYRARDLKADTDVALKLLPHAGGLDVRLLRFRRELQMARKVTHPNVVRIHDLVELPGRFGLSMELVDGESLEHRIGRGRMSREEVVGVAVDLARALAAAHEAGVVHRDLKPSNVLLRTRDGRAVVTDFGVSRALGSDAGTATAMSDATPIKLTREGAIIGTPQYMAPEQLEGRADVGPSADVYAYGLVVWEAATGTPRQKGETLGDLRGQQRDPRERHLRDERPDLPKRLCEAVDRALSFEPRGRFASGGQLLSAVESLGSRPRGAHVGLLAIAAGAGIVALVVAGIAFSRGRHPLGAGAATPTTTVPASSAFELDPVGARRLTFGVCDEFPSFTPDSGAVAYDSMVGEDSFIFLVPLTGGAPKQLTQVHGWDTAPRVSPAGDRVAFIRFEGTRYRSYVAPMDGSEPPRELGSAKVHPTWTPDGQGIWASDGTSLVDFDARTGTARRHLTPKAQRTPVTVLETSSGTILALFQGNTDQDNGAVGVVSSEGDVRWLFEQTMSFAFALTRDERHVLAMRDMFGNEAELVDVPLDGSPVRALASNHVKPFAGIAISPDGLHVAWSTCHGSLHPVSFDRAGRKQLVFKTEDEEAGMFALIPGTRDYVVASERGGTAGLWVEDPTGARPARSIRAPEGVSADLALSPDGSLYAVSGSHGVFVGSLRGDGPPRQLTTDSLDSGLAFRFGGKELLFARHQGDAPPRVMGVPLEGGSPAPVLEPGSDSAATSPVDERIAYLAGPNAEDVMPTVWDPRTNTRRPVSPQLHRGKYRHIAFSLDGRKLAIAVGTNEVVEVDATTGALGRTWKTGAESVHHVLYTPDGLVVLTATWQGALWVADLAPTP